MRRGFTLIELLVVISIIVILLAVLVPAMSRAMRASENAQCLSNQANILKSLTQYMQEHDQRFPPANAGRRADVLDPSFAYAQELRSIDLSHSFLPIQEDTATVTGRQPLGLGLLVGKYLPASSVGKVIHCPRLDTSGVSSVDGRQVILGYGMDQIGSTNETAGGSHWERTDATQPDYRIASSYNYRGSSREKVMGGSLSYLNARGNTVFLADFPDRQYGVKFHHGDGYNRTFGDGSSAFFRDEPLARAGETVPLSEVERIPVDPAHPAWGAAPQPHNNASTAIDGQTNERADEAIYRFMASDRG